MKIWNRFAAFTLSAAIMLGSVSVFAENENTKKDIELSEGFSVWETISEYVSENYVDESLTKEDIMLMGLSEFLNDEEAMVSILKKTLGALDPYSDFMTYDEYISYIDNMDGILHGLGVTIEQREDGVYITGFSDGSLAPDAGFKAGDKIVEIDGENVEDRNLSEVRAAIVGEIDTTVKITVLRDGEYINLIGTRCAINTATVAGGILKGNIGYMQIYSFGSNTSSEVEEILSTFSQSDVKKLIIDLRDNPGGLVSAAVEVSRMLVPSGKIIDVVYRDSKLNQSYYSALQKKYYDTIILVNENTASSSEIFASAMQQSGAAKLYGTTTYGKGLVQATIPLLNGSVIKMTTGKYVTRNGSEINGIGIEPDEYIVNQKEKIDVSGYTKFTFMDKWVLGDSGDPVKAAKERLQMLGYYSGNPTNNIFNVQLQDALKTFQSENQLSASGVLDIPTQVKLDSTFGMLEKEVDIQLQRAYETLGGNVYDLYA